MASTHAFASVSSADLSHTRVYTQTDAGDIIEWRKDEPHAWTWRLAGIRAKPGAPMTAVASSATVGQPDKPVTIRLYFKDKGNNLVEAEWTGADWVGSDGDRWTVKQSLNYHAAR